MESRDDIESVCQRLGAARAPQLPLFRAAADRQISLAMIAQHTSVWPRSVARCKLPAVVVIGDDPWPASLALGPYAWACSRGAREWARFVVVRGSGASPDHYRAAAQAAQHYRRLLFVESDSAHADEWAAFFGRDVMRFDPPPGRVHPSRAGETMH
jgi:hypothetical protein